MAQHGRKYTTARGTSIRRVYSPLEAVRLLKAIDTAKFDETVEVHVRLGVDVATPTRSYAAPTILPHGTGKTVRIAVFAEGDKAREAQQAGADLVGADDLAKQMQEGRLDFDVAIATPDMMGIVGKLGRVLGPRGLMPNPKSGTVTFDVAKAVSDAKGGKVEYRTDRTGIIHLASARSRSPKCSSSRTTAWCSTRSCAPSRPPPRVAISRACMSPPPWDHRSRSTVAHQDLLEE